MDDRNQSLLRRSKSILWGTDRNNIYKDMNALVKLFIPTKVNTLNGKPKMFFFQIDLDIAEDDIISGDDMNAAAQPVAPDDDMNAAAQPAAPDYPDAFKLSSTHRDFLGYFADVLVDENRKTLNSILEVVARKTMPLATKRENYQIVKTLNKEVFFGPYEREGELVEYTYDSNAAKKTAWIIA